MTKRVLIQGDGRLCDIVAVGQDFPVASPFHWENCPDDTTPTTHEWNGSAVVVKTVTLADAKAAKLAALAAKLAWFDNMPLAWNLNGTNYTFNTVASKVALASARAKAANLNDGDTVDVVDDSGQTMAPTKYALNFTLNTYDSLRRTAMARYHVRVAAVNAATTVQDVEAVNAATTVQDVEAVNAELGQA